MELEKLTYARVKHLSNGEVESCEITAYFDSDETFEDVCNQLKSKVAKALNIIPFASKEVDHEKRKSIYLEAVNGFYTYETLDKDFVEVDLNLRLLVKSDLINRNATDSEKFEKLLELIGLLDSLLNDGVNQ